MKLLQNSQKVTKLFNSKKHIVDMRLPINLFSKMTSFELRRFKNQLFGIVAYTEFIDQLIIGTDKNPVKIKDQKKLDEVLQILKIKNDFKLIENYRTHLY